MRVFYTSGVLAYKLLIWLASPFNPKAKKWILGRRDSFRKIESTNWTKDVVWFHCASLGEFEQGRPLLERIKKQTPERQVLVTFFSPSGYEIRKNYEHADCICYLPVDTKRNAARLFQAVPISDAYFVKYEFWANYILTSQKFNIKVYSLATLLRPSQHFFKWWGGFFRRILRQITHFYVQNEQTKELLNSIQLDNVTIIGDPRFDRVYENAQQVKPNSIFEKFCVKDTLVVGSSWSQDEELLLPIINNTNFNDLVLIAPHEVHNQHINEIEKGLTKPYQLYTDLENGAPLKPETQVIIINCIGILADTYQYGQYAYVGGAFGSGLHNILEPCVFGLPVVFGPKHSRFPEAKEFIEKGIGKSISTQEELASHFLYVKSNISELQKKCKQHVANNVGASDKVLDSIKN